MSPSSPLTSRTAQWSLALGPMMAPRLVCIPQCAHIIPVSVMSSDCHQISSVYLKGQHHSQGLPCGQAGLFWQWWMGDSEGHRQPWSEDRQQLHLSYHHLLLHYPEVASFLHPLPTEDRRLLNGSTDSACLMASGRLFQSQEAATEKALSPDLFFFHERGNANILRWEDLRGLLVL